MSYKPMTADEAVKLNIRPEGIYGIEVADAKAGTSKSGNSMIALTLHVYDADGDRFTVKDWLVHSDSRWAEKKVYDFACAVGIEAQYSAGTMTAEDCLGRTGFAMIVVQKGQPKADGSGNFPDRNGVKYYTANKPAAKAAASGNTEGAQADAPTEDVPF